MTDRDLAIDHDAGLATIDEAIPRSVRKWCDRVVRLRWGALGDFKRAGLAAPDPYFLNRFVGTGVRFPTGCVLTCGHVLSPRKEIPFPDVAPSPRRAGRAWFREVVRAMQVVDSIDGCSHTGVEHVSYWGPRIDVAYLFTGVAEASNRLPAVAGRAARNGEHVFVLHHPGGGPLAITSGRVREVGSTGLWFAHDAATRGGSSGGAVVGRDGRFLGLHRGVDSPGRGVAVAARAISTYTRKSPHTGKTSDRRRLPQPPRIRQEIDVGTFEVRFDPNKDPVALVWVDGFNHEAWAFKSTFVDVGLGQLEYGQLHFKQIADWWTDQAAFNPPLADPVTWSPRTPDTWPVRWEAWATYKLSALRSSHPVWYHSRHNQPQQ